jgi:hypothetical protein
MAVRQGHFHAPCGAALAKGDGRQCDLQHRFFKSPSICAVNDCKKLIVGLTASRQQGRICTRCGGRVHAKCLLNGIVAAGGGVVREDVAVEEEVDSDPDLVDFIQVEASSDAD